MTYSYRNYIKVIIEEFPISHAYDAAKETGWSVGQPAIFHPCFSGGSTVLFQIQEPLYSCTVLGNNFIHIIDSGIFWFSHYLGYLPTRQLFFFFSFWSASECEWNGKYFQWLPITTIDITINYFYCITIVSQSTLLFILRSEGDWCVLALNISNIISG